MRVAVIVSSTLDIDISKYIPLDATEVITTGGGEGRTAERWADDNYIPKLIIKSDKRLRLSRERIANVLVEISDNIVAVWDGTQDLVGLCIDCAHAVKKPMVVFEQSRVLKPRRELLKRYGSFLALKQCASPVVSE